MTDERAPSNEPRAVAPAGPSAIPALDQISVYLIRPEATDYVDALREPGELEDFDVNVPGLSGRLFIRWPEAKSPRWLEFLRAVSGAELPFEGNRHVSAVLFVDRGGRRFALTFGFGRHLLRPDTIEPDYGLRVAANLVNPDELASVDSRSIEATTLNVRRQSSRGSRLASIGFDVGREMLRALAGRLPEESFGSRITGSDAVGLTSRLDAATLGERLDSLQEAYESEQYRTTGFGHIDRWKPLPKGPRRDELDAFLLEALEKRREAVLQGEDPRLTPGPTRSMHLAAPSIIEYRASGFRSTGEADGVIHPFPDLDAYLRSTDRRAPTDADLRVNHRLQLISSEPDEVTDAWPIYKALSWEVELEGDTYVLTEGNWWLIDPAYRASIDARLGDLRPAVLERPDFDPIEWEVDYNERLSGAGATPRVMLDRELARFAGETGPIENATSSRPSASSST
jgi:uncharacterized protein (TIGR04141 family)